MHQDKEARSEQETMSDSTATHREGRVSRKGWSSQRHDSQPDELNIFGGVNLIQRNEQALTIMSPHVTDFSHLKTPRLSLDIDDDYDSYEAPPTITARHPNAIDDGLFVIDIAAAEIGIGPKSGSDGMASKPAVSDLTIEAETITSLKNMVVALSLKLKARTTIDNQTENLKLMLATSE